MLGALATHLPHLNRPRHPLTLQGKGGKNRRRGKNEGEDKRELETKEEGQVRYGAWSGAVQSSWSFLPCAVRLPPFAAATYRSMPR